MGEFINTVDQLGDETVFNSIIEGTITELKDDTITTIASSCLSYLYGTLIKVDCPNATSIKGNTLSYNYDMKYVRTKATLIEGSAFRASYELTAVVLCGDTVCTLVHANAFYNCFHYNGTVDAKYNPDGLKDGYIYVPKALIEDYKVATNWATYADQFRAIEDYTVDGTIYGELDESKI